MRSEKHIDSGLLIGSLDGEVSDADFVEVRSHLATCPACKQKRDQFAELSRAVESIVGQPSSASLQTIETSLLDYEQLEREKLAWSLSAATVPVSRRKLWSLEQFGWGVALAATLAIGIFVAPRVHMSGSASFPAASPAPPAFINVNGESFLALPYSNPDLPLNAPRIVEMQVPASALAGQGIVFDPAGTGAPDRMVLANVLLGIDGQPLGVHVLSAE